MKNPIDIGSPLDVMIIDADMVMSIGYYPCQDRVNCNRPYHYMIELKTGRQVQVTKEKFVTISTQLGVMNMITMPEAVDEIKKGVM